MSVDNWYLVDKLFFIMTLFSTFDQVAVHLFVKCFLLQTFGNWKHFWHPDKCAKYRNRMLVRKITLLFAQNINFYVFHLRHFDNKKSSWKSFLFSWFIFLIIPLITRERDHHIINRREVCGLKIINNGLWWSLLRVKRIWSLWSRGNFYADT